LEAQGKALLPSDALEDDLALMTCGLDSLGFATLVVQLEEAFGFDPFSQMERLVFPRTFGELVSLYECSVSS
jgi:acyl carrier protein